MSGGVSIVSAAEVGGAARLESLWLRAFGAGDRAPGWFARKLAREHVSDALTRVAVASGENPRSPLSWRGMVLVGAPPGLPDAVRTAGTCVLSAARGSGIGRALLHAVCEGAAAAGRAWVELLAQSETIPFYERVGFEVVSGVVTLQGAGIGHDHDHDHDHDHVGMERVEIRGFCADEWAGSAGGFVLSLCGGDGSTSPLGGAVVSREGIAWLVHRFWGARATGDPRLDVAAAALALRNAVPAAAPILVPLLDPVSSITVHLREAGFEVVQRGALMRRRTTARLA